MAIAASVGASYVASGAIYTIIVRGAMKTCSRKILTSKFSTTSIMVNVEAVLLAASTILESSVAEVFAIFASSAIL